MRGEAVRVLARFEAKPGKEDDLAVVLEKLIEPTRAEAGCRRYELWRNRADPTEFTFVEEWVSQDALSAHGQTEHIQKGREAMVDLVTGPVDLRLYDRVR